MKIILIILFFVLQNLSMAKDYNFFPPIHNSKLYGRENFLISSFTVSPFCYDLNKNEYVNLLDKNLDYIINGNILGINTKQQIIFFNSDLKNNNIINLYSINENKLIESKILNQTFLKNSINLSENGKYFYAFDTNRIYIWSSDSLNLLINFKVDNNYIKPHKIAFSSNDSCFIFSDNNLINIVNIYSGKTIDYFLLGRGQPNKILCENDNIFSFSNSVNSKPMDCFIYNLKTFEVDTIQNYLQIVSENIEILDGKKILFVSKFNGKFTVFDYEKNEYKDIDIIEGGIVEYCKFRYDNIDYLSFDNSNGQLYLIDLVKNTYKIFKFSNFQKICFTSENNKILIEPQSFSPITLLNIDESGLNFKQSIDTSFKVNSDISDYIFQLSRDSILRFKKYNDNTFKTFKYSKNLTNAIFNKDFTFGAFENSNKNSYSLWDINSNKLINENLDGLVSFSNIDNIALIKSELNDSLKIYDMILNKIIFEMGSIKAFFLTDKNDEILIQDINNLYYFFDINKFTVLDQFDLLTKDSLKIKRIVFFQSNNYYLIIYSNGKSELYNTEENMLIKTYDEYFIPVNSDYISSISINKNKFAILFLNQALIIYNLPSEITDFSDDLEYNKLFLTPIPANDYIDISLESPTKKWGQGNEPFEIYNIFGEKIPPLHFALQNATPQEGNLRIDISNLPSGVYFIKIGNQFEKFVK